MLMGVFLGIFSCMDSNMMIDCDCVEKWEIVVMFNYYVVFQIKKGSKCLSWIGFVVIVGQKNGVSVGMIGFEQVCKGCKGCNGYKVCEVSWLLCYVFMGYMMDKNMLEGNMVCFL